MTGATKVAWTEDALDDWRRLPMSDALAVAQAVQRWASSGQGFVIASEGFQYLLLVGSTHVVEFLLDTVTQTMYVTRVRRA
jgi:hypothetical protein